MDLKITKTGLIRKSTLHNCPIFIPKKIKSLSDILKKLGIDSLIENRINQDFEGVLQLYFYKFFAGDRSLVRGFADISTQDLYLWKNVNIATSVYVKEVLNSTNKFRKVVNAISNRNKLSKSFLIKQNKYLRPKEKILGIRTKRIRAGNPKTNKYAFYCAPPENINELFDDWLDYVNNDKELIINKAMIGMIQFIFIHPFNDGNGRITRAYFLAMMKKKFSLSFSCLAMMYLKNINPMMYYAAMHDYRNGNISNLRQLHMQTIQWANNSIDVLNGLLNEYSDIVDIDNIINDNSYCQIVTSNLNKNSTFNKNVFELMAEKNGKYIYMNTALLSCINQFDYYLRSELRNHNQQIMKLM